ncbi:MAG: GRP family sugar transporter [Planctomycetota bacterium]
MVIIQSYSAAILMCFITMLCWGSWANTQKLATKEWKFQLFYWDYSIGVLLLSLIMAFTMGSFGGFGRSFIDDITQVTAAAFLFAFLGGVVFNLANILLVAAIDIAGLAVAFPIGIGIALVEGVIINYILKPKGNPILLFAGVLAIMIAVIIDALAYKKLPSEGQKTTGKGIVISVVAGVLMGLFYYLVQKGIVAEFVNPEAGKLGPYAAVVVFSLGLFVSSFLWNSIVMAKPFVGEPVPFGDYFKKGNPRLHLIGILGGVIWSIGMSFNIVASGTAGPAISYGLGQGATMIAALWGVFIWKEFKSAPAGTNKQLALMFVFYIVGLSLLIIAKMV